MLNVIACWTVMLGKTCQFVQLKIFIYRYNMHLWPKNRGFWSYITGYKYKEVVFIIYQGLLYIKPYNMHSDPQIHI